MCQSRASPTLVHAVPTGKVLVGTLRFAHPTRASTRSTTASTRQHEIDGFRPFALLVGLDIKRDPLPFAEGLQSGVLHRRDMHEYVAPAVVRFYEAVSAFAIEEFDRAGHCHRENSCPVLARRRPPRRGGRVDIRRSQGRHL